ncbi:MAG: IS4 family transposase [Bacteroidota bacterium]
MTLAGHTRCSRLSSKRSKRAVITRFFNNDRVTLDELTHVVTRLDESSVKDRDLLVDLDGCTVNVCLGNKGRLDWIPNTGVATKDKSPAVQIMPALVLDLANKDCLGLGDIAIFGRPPAKGTKQQRNRLKAERKQLPFAHKESSVWSQVAINTAQQAVSAKRITFVMDQGADIYQSFQEIIDKTGRDLIVRVNRNRKSTAVATGEHDDFDGLLQKQPVASLRKIEIPPLNHISKGDGKRKKRKGRCATLELRYLSVLLDRPDKYPQERGSIERPLCLIEVREQAQNVPEGEKPILWRLLTTWSEMDEQRLWQAVEAYRCRWHIEQLFRIIKGQGLGIDSSQVKRPETLKKLLVMSVKIAADAIRLTNARQGDEFIPIEEMFDADQQETLAVANKELSGQTKTVTNPHPTNSLAYAAWIIARLGEWDGYQSQRPPGPMRMQRGLRRFYEMHNHFTLFKKYDNT